MATKLEQELRTAAKHLGCWSYNGNDELPLCDRIVCWNGLSILFEAKQTISHLLSLGCVTKNERKQLRNHQEHGRGLSLVVIERNFSNRARCWVITWDNWLHLETLPAKSIQLEDGKRPAQLLEAVRVERPNSLGQAWNLLPILHPLAWQQYYRLEAALDALDLS